MLTGFSTRPLATETVTTRSIENYPYYVYNGYRYRYSTSDYCNYQLVDSNNHQVVQTYWNQLCNTGYDSCSYERDRLNSQMNDYRYFCSETWRDYGYDYSTPSYEDSNYGSDDNTCSDANHDGMCDDYSDSCSDNDGDGYCDQFKVSNVNNELRQHHNQSDVKNILFNIRCV